jgi:hypothetical protein
MKNIFTVLGLFFISSLMAQSIASIAYYKVPREEAAQFIRSHQKFTDLSSSDDRLLRGGGVFAHVHADNYTYVSYDFYDSVSDLEKDGPIASAALKTNIDALKLSKKEKEALTKEYRKYN